VEVKSCRVVAGVGPLSRFNSNAASRLLEAAIAMCSLYLSLASMTIPRTLTWSFGKTVCPLMANGSESNLYALWVKYMIAVFSASNVAPLLLSQSSASPMMASMPSRLLSAIGLVA